MKKLNSKGSSPLHIVLILVIVGLIAGVGYYVYNSQKKTNTALDNAAKSQVDPQKSEKKENLFVHEKPGFSFEYPEGWSQKETKLGDPNVNILDVSFTSSDRKLILDSPFGELETGGAFGLSVIVTTHKDTADYQENAEGVGGPIEPTDTTVNGVTALRGKCGHPIVQLECVTFVNDGYLYELTYHHTQKEDVTNAKYLNEFNTLIESFKFKD